MGERFLRWLIRGWAWQPLGWVRAWGRLLGRILWLCNGRSRQVTERNLALVWPSMAVEARRDLAYRSLLATGETALELLWVWGSPYQRVLAHIREVEGEELLETDGKGLVVIAPHLGNWEVIGLALSQRCLLTCLFQPPRNQAFGELIRDARSCSGAKLAPTDIKGVAALARALKQGEAVGILPDQVPDQGSGEFVPFMGVPALTMTLVHSLMKRQPCQAVMAVAERVPGGFRLCFREPDAQIYAADPIQALAAMNDSIAQCIAHIPEQYQWEYKRFRKQPDGSKPYKGLA